VHFPVVLLCNVVFAVAAPATPTAGVLAALLAWAASLVIGALFYRGVESQAERWKKAAAQALAPTFARLAPTVKTNKP
jgi:peptidoglycan/LPS O-acetylase OafA/YrhL